MEQVMGFTELKVGQRVKIKGNHGSNGSFTALEVKIKPSDENASVESKIQAVDMGKKSIRLMNRDFQITGESSILDLSRNKVGIEALKAGDRVKIKGEYTPDGSFKIEKLKVQQISGYDVDELQGFINEVDMQNRTLQVIGFRVVLDKNTEIEGF